MNKNFGNFSTAKDIKNTIKTIAQAEVEKLRPALKTAIVDQIFTAEKYCMVTYVGESLSVKVPYNNVAPSYVGQYVRIGGPANDRRIEEVLGETDSEDRLAKIEALLERHEPAFGSWFRSVNTTINQSIVSVTLTDATFTPVGFDPPAGSEVAIPTTGWYEVYAQITTSSKALKDLYIQVVPISGAASYDIAQATSMMDADAMSVDALTLSSKRIAHLKAGDKVKMNIGCGVEYTLFGGRRTCFEIKRIISDAV